MREGISPKNKTGKFKIARALSEVNLLATSFSTDLNTSNFTAFYECFQI